MARGKFFSETMYEAVLSGTKTMFRSPIKPQPTGVRNSVFVKSGLEDYHGRELKPRYLPGESLYIKEPYKKHTHSLVMGVHTSILYKYGELQPCNKVGLFNGGKSYYTEWQNKLFMPERFARNYIEIISVKAEKLQDISENEAILEGIGRWNGFYHANLFDKKTGQLLVHKTPQQAFAALWDSINKKNKWETNPWCFCYEFRLIK